jgi:hypothetical protein
MKGCFDLIAHLVKLQCFVDDVFLLLQKGGEGGLTSICLVKSTHPGTMLARCANPKLHVNKTLFFFGHILSLIDGV